MPPDPIPLVVLTGFLGAGKTTLLNAWLRDPALADTLVIINEFGEIGLDHLLVEAARDDLVLLKAGCLCCTIRGSLSATLENLLRRRDNGRIEPFARVIVETTGLAEPAPVLNAVANHPYLAKRYRLAGVVTTVDAVNGADTLARHGEAQRQAAVADLIVLTKSDLADETAARRAIRAVNAVAPVETDPVRALSAVLGLTRDSEAPRLLAEGPDDRADRDHHHDRSHHDHHHHDINRHDAAIQAVALTSDHPVSATALDLFLSLLRDLQGPNLLRMKGLVALEDDPDRPLVVQAVQHVLHPLRQLEAWPDDLRTTRLVFIVKDTDTAVLRDLWGILIAPSAKVVPA